MRCILFYLQAQRPLGRPAPYSGNGINPRARCSMSATTAPSLLGNRSAKGAPVFPMYAMDPAPSAITRHCSAGLDRPRQTRARSRWGLVQRDDEVHAAQTLRFVRKGPTGTGRSDRGVLPKRMARKCQVQTSIVRQHPRRAAGGAPRYRRPSINTVEQTARGFGRHRRKPRIPAVAIPHL